MRHRAIKIGLTSAVLVLAFGGLLWTTMRSGTEYYEHVNEVMAHPQQWEGKHIQLHGFVVKDSILRKPNTLQYRFRVENKGSVVTAMYTGVVPDTFKSNAEVVLKGTLEPDGFHVQPDGVMAKCPSKYNPSKTPGTTAGM